MTSRPCRFPSSSNPCRRRSCSRRSTGHWAPSPPATATPCLSSTRVTATQARASKSPHRLVQAIDPRREDDQARSRTEPRGTANLGGSDRTSLPEPWEKPAPSRSGAGFPPLRPPDLEAFAFPHQAGCDFPNRELRLIFTFDPISVKDVVPPMGCVFCSELTNH